MDLKAHQTSEDLNVSNENSMDLTNKSDQQIKFGVAACTQSYKYHNSPLGWNNLPDALKSVIPTDEMYTYIVEEYNELPKEEYPDSRFTAAIRINLNNDEEAKEWIGKMSEHSKSYRVTRTYKPSLK